MVCEPWAVGSNGEPVFEADSPGLPLDWQISEDMPEDLAYYLVVTGVHRERLFDLTEAGALAEGLNWPSPEEPFHSAVEIYLQYIWPGIAYNWGGDAFTTEKNPWVWVVNFDPITSKKEALYYSEMLTNYRNEGNYETF